MTVNFSSYTRNEVLSDLLRWLINNKDLGLTDLSPYSLHVQMLDAFAMVAHLCNTNINVSYQQALLGSTTLLESLREQLLLIGYNLRMATPAITEVVARLTKDFTVGATAEVIVPELSQFATDATDANDPVIFENLADVTIDNTTDEFTHAVPLALADSDTDGVLDADNPTYFSAAGLALTSADVDGYIQITGSEQGRNGTYRIAAVLSATQCTLDGANFVDESAVSWNLFRWGTNDVANLTAGVATTTLFPSMTVGDAFYFGHEDIEWIKQVITVTTAQSGGDLSWEYRSDPQFNAVAPTDVNDQSSFLEFDCTSLLNTQKRKGLEVTVRHRQTGLDETLPVLWGTGTGGAFSTSVNYIKTTGLLGQVAGSYSTNVEDYDISAEWMPIPDAVDDTIAFADTKTVYVSWSLPESATESWKTFNVAGDDVFAIRVRIVDTGMTISPVLSYAAPQEDKYLKFFVVQGETFTEELGASDGQPDQRFLLSYTDLFRGSSDLEVSTIESEWTEVLDNFAASSRDNIYAFEFAEEETYLKFFGRDGRGRIPPVGSTITLQGRSGGELDGNIGANTLTVNQSGVGYVDVSQVGNPRAAVGHRYKDGYSDEDIARLKVAAPASLRSLSGLTAPDTIERAAIEWQDASGGAPIERATLIPNVYGTNAHQLVVVGTAGAFLADSTIEDLSEFFNGDITANPPKYSRLANNGSVTVVQYKRRYIDVTATIVGGGDETVVKQFLLQVLNPAYKTAEGDYVHTAGGELSLSQIYSWIHSTDASIRKVILTNPTSNTALSNDEYVYPGDIAITRIP